MSSAESAWLDEFVGCLNGAYKDELAFERAFLIKHDHLPRRLFKYRPCNDFAFSNLESDTVWLSAASKYNDPFDSAIAISFRRLNATVFPSKFDELPFLEKLKSILTDEELAEARASPDPMEFMASTVLGKNPKLPRDKLPAMLEALGVAVERISLPVLEGIRKSIQDHTVICSFSTVPESIIMWGHYADKHQGICMEYDLESIGLDDIRRRMLFPVIYEPELFDATKYFAAAALDLARFNNTFPTVAALYKSPEWAYEREWRLIFPGGVLRECNYSMPAARVLMGARISDSDKEKVTSICRKKNIDCVQMQLSARAFKLEAKGL